MPVPFRIPIPINGGGSYEHATLPILVSREGHDPSPHSSRSNDDDEGKSQTIIIVIVFIIAVIIISAGGFVFLKRRADKHRRQLRQGGHLEPYSSTTSNGRRLGSGNDVSETNRNSTASNIDRNTSIRSIMTLPKYRHAANEDEQVLGREGERDGVDIILEMPSDEQHEALRDEEMETMYQIRLARRQLNAEREERRRLQQEARDRGDLVALEELRARRRAENEDTTIDDLRDAQGQIRTRRERAVSSVSYHDLGVARHDGSRIRANSTESERVGLLSDAASIAVSTRSPSAMSGRRVSDIGSIAMNTRSPSAHSHHRIHSVSSVVSLDNNGEVSPRSGATTPQLGGGRYTRAGSSPEIVTEADLGDSDMPPPDYEDVTLDDVRCGATTPMFHEPPPDYSGHGHRNSDSESGDLTNPSPTDDDRSRRSSHRSSRGVGGVPQLPSLRIRELPQIVIEPSTAHPGEPAR
ncbi:hypothetical protein F5B22DRAFT_281076 [Xylaria bambusicola]|uniref:uncharacterized protein n=1 Tax=Xylaria bambusicola TaxID=326684 RepID=UPI002007CEE8|nr:uncharacterized protein F5B22DRAFT_281076 [Xylaria bambusicola]KAI0512953.1 hypothetical protein F5B22DRAFT_281076 [Xylaria bambusicola]